MILGSHLFKDEARNFGPYDSKSFWAPQSLIIVYCLVPSMVGSFWLTLKMHDKMKKKKSIHSVCRESENYIFGNLTEDTFRKKSKFFVKCYHGHIILASLSYFWFLNLLCHRLVKIKHCQIHSLRSNKHSGRLLISDVHMVIDSCLASWLLESFSWLCG